MLPFMNKSNIIGLGLAAIALALMLASPNYSLAQERYPAVARISFVSGPVTYSRGDDPSEWDDAVENVPLTIGDRIYSPADGHVELQLSSGNFVRLAPRSYFSNLNLSDDVKQFYLGEGVASFNIRRLQSDEVIEIDTPNVSVTLDEPGQYRIAVDENGDSRVTVRRGRVTVAANGRQIAVENSEIRIYGIDSPRYEIVGLPAGDAFDRWASERDNRFDRSYAEAYRYASDEIIGVEDLSEYGRWEQIPEYGYAWTPAAVAVGWLPFSAGRWFWQDPWGWTWISHDRWGWATSHYGRWTQYRSRWYWVPVRPRTRVIYAPACVEFVRMRDHVGWFPLHPRDRHIPWWDRRDRFDRNVTYVNRNYVTIVNQNTFISARPVNKYIVRDRVVVREAQTAPFRSQALPIPNRSSLRVISESAGRRGFRPPVNVINRAAVVRTAPPLPPPTFQEKLPQIQKSDGKPVGPSQASALVSATDKTRAERIRFRPAAEDKGGQYFAPRNPAVKSGPAPQPVTAARGKKLATRESAAAQSAPAPAGQKVGAAGQPDAPKPQQERERQLQQKQIIERERQPQQQELERRKQEQQKEQQRKATLQEQQRQQRLQEQEQRELERKAKEPRKELQRQPSREQQRLEEPERHKAQSEEERKAQALQQEQERREQLKRQQLQDRQIQQQRQQESERRQPQEQNRKAQALQQQQEQARREQARRQQMEEHQALQQQKQQEIERRLSERRAQQQQNQDRIQQQRQQQLQERQTQQQQPRRRQPEPQKEVERKPSPLQQPPAQP